LGQSFIASALAISAPVDFAPIGLIASIPIMVQANPATPVSEWRRAG